MSTDYITIPLSKRSKENAGKYEAIVDSIDGDLEWLDWTARIQSNSETIYAHRRYNLNGKYHYLHLHRVIMGRMVDGGRDLLPDESVDHIDGNGLNNQRSNLRLATHSQNQYNAQKRKDNTSGYKGVSWYKKSNRWRATIQANGKNQHLGYFDTPELAYEAYCIAAKELHGEFANCGDE